MGKQLLIKPEKCLGCRTCELVCSFGTMEHSIQDLPTSA